MTIRAVAHGFAQSGNATSVVATVDTSGCSGLVVGVVDISTTSSTLVDLGSNIWTPLTAQPLGSAQRTQLYFCANPIVGSGHTFIVTSNSGNSFPSVAIEGFSGTGALSPFDIENGSATIGSFTSSQPGSVSPTVDGELIITFIGNANATTVATPDLGFTRTDGAVTSAGLAYGFAMAYLIQTTKGAVNPTWSWTANDDKNSVIACFKAQPENFLVNVRKSQAIKRPSVY